MGVHLVLVIDASQTRLDAVLQAEHAVLVDQSHYRNVARSRDEIPTGLGAHPTAEMAVDHDGIEAVLLEKLQSCPDRRHALDLRLVSCADRGQ